MARGVRTGPPMPDAPRSPIAALPTAPKDAEPGVVYAVIETPKGSRHKLDFDPALGVFALNKVMPAGQSFPFDFGFVPGTVGGDGDPLDVLVLMDDPTWPGVVVEARLLGVLEAEQTERDGTTERNDRLVAAATVTRHHADLRTLADVSAVTLDEVEEFFRSYNALAGKEVRFLGRGDAERARAVLDEGVRAAGAR